MKKYIGAAGLLMVLASGVQAYGEVGQWSTGWGQGTTEFTAVVNQRTNLYIACSDSAPVAMTLTVDGKTFGSHEKKGFNLIVDGKEIETPYDTGSRVGANNFLYVWEAMRKAKKIQARAASGQLIDLPTKGAAKILPKSMTKSFPCSVDF